MVNRMNLQEYKGVFIYAQQVDNKIDSIALELLGKANDLAADLGTDVTAVLIGSDVKGLVDELAEYGADRVIVVDDPALKEYRTEPYTHALASVINEYKPDILLVGATAIGRDLGPRVSARVATGLTADCTSCCFTCRLQAVCEFSDFSRTVGNRIGLLCCISLKRRRCK